MASFPIRGRRRALARLSVALAAPALLGFRGVLAASAADPDKAAAILAHIGEATCITEGQGRRTVHVFFDPNCPYCHHLYTALRPHVAAGAIRVCWIPLGFLTATSLPKAAAMLQAPNPLKAFQRNEEDYDFAANGQPGGGLEPAGTISAPTRAALARNLELYNSQKLFGVPVMVWQRAGGADMLVGVPGEAKLREILASVR